MYPNSSFRLEVTLCALICAIVFAIMYWADAAKCHDQWDQSGLKAEYQFMGGCMVQRKDGTWVPAKSIRN